VAGALAGVAVGGTTAGPVGEFAAGVQAAATNASANSRIFTFDCLSIRQLSPPRWGNGCALAYM
jgi:hypothetical protein